MGQGVRDKKFAWYFLNAGTDGVCVSDATGLRRNGISKCVDLREFIYCGVVFGLLVTGDRRSSTLRVLKGR